MSDKIESRVRRAQATRAKIRQLKAVRLTVHRSNKHIYAQVIDETASKVLASAPTAEKAVRAAVKGGGNVSRWCNNDFEGLVQKAKLATRQTDRAGFYAKAQEIVHEEAPWIPIAHSVRFDPVMKAVTG